MHLLFGFSGRIGRGGWWLAQLANIVVGLVCLGVVGAFAPDLHGPNPLANLPAGLVAAVLAFVALMTWINLASTVKRFHDRDKSGWWFLISFVPYIGGLWIIVECGCLAGTPGGNSYGSPNGGSRPLGLDDLDIEALSPSAQTRSESFRPAAAVPAAPAPRRRSATPQGFGRRTA